MLSSRCQEFSSIDCYAGVRFHLFQSTQYISFWTNFFFSFSQHKKIDVIGIITRTRVRKWLKCLLSCILQFCHLYSRSYSFLLLFFFALSLSLPRSLTGWLVLFELVFVLFSIKGKYLLLVFHFDVAVAIVLLLVLCSSS